MLLGFAPSILFAGKRCCEYMFCMLKYKKKSKNSKKQNPKKKKKEKDEKRN